MNTLLPTLQALETELHHPGVPCTRQRLDHLLHPDFNEVGRSGAAYSRETVLGYLAGVTTPPAVVSDGFDVAELVPGVAVLTYRSVALGGHPSEPALYTLRASVWQRTAVGWQLRYHQGTPAAQPWASPRLPVLPPE